MAIPDLSTIIALLCSVLAVLSAATSAWVAFRIYSEGKDDERIFFGPWDHPYRSVTNSSHYSAVVCCVAFNKARRKAYIKDIRAFDRNGETVEVEWGASIDREGNLSQPNELIGLVDSSDVYVRRNDGEFISYLTFEIRHSCPASPYIQEVRTHDLQ